MGEKGMGGWVEQVIRAVGFTDPSCSREEGGAGVRGRETQRPHPPGRQFSGLPPSPEAHSPGRGSSRGTCCLGTGRPATCVCQE